MFIELVPNSLSSDSPPTEVVSNLNPPNPHPAVSHDLITLMFYSMWSCLTCNFPHSAISPKIVLPAGDSYCFQSDTCSLLPVIFSDAAWIWKGECSVEDFYKATMSPLHQLSSLCCIRNTCQSGITEYRRRWWIETQAACLKSRKHTIHKGKYGSTAHCEVHFDYLIPLSV